MANASCTGILNSIFPKYDNTTAVPLLTNPSSISVQSIPVISTLLVWIFVEAYRQRKRATTMHRTTFLFLGTGGAALAALFTWRFFELLECDANITSDVHAWKVVAIISSVVTSLVLLGVCATRMVRAGIVLTILLAGGIVFLDWALRGGFITTVAAIPLYALQQAWCIQTTALFPQIVARTSKRSPSAARPITVVDPLAARVTTTVDATPADRALSWFV